MFEDKFWRKQRFLLFLTGGILLLSLIGRTFSSSDLFGDPGRNLEDIREIDLRSVDVNLDDEGTLASLPGIGPVLARRIIQERKERPFSGAKDLERVRGIGSVKSSAMEPYLLFPADETTLPPRQP